MFSPQKVAAYYNTTLEHYEIWWNLKRSLALHYGIWDNDTPDFQAALINTNRVLCEHANVKSGHKVLDAGCGVGGSSMYLAEHYGCQVVGITLSEKQLAYGQKKIDDRGLSGKIKLETMDYTNTSFESSSFDIVWACESMCHATDKKDFVREMFRVLKTGGRLVVSDFFVRDIDQKDPEKLMTKWGATWGVAQFPNSKAFANDLKEEGFQSIELFDYTGKIRKSAKRMYLASLLGSIPSEIYNLFHPKVSEFAKTHYKCGYYQYKALKRGLWKYNVVLGVK